jgi:hypothetical protein
MTSPTGGLDAVRMVRRRRQARDGGLDAGRRGAGGPDVQQLSATGTLLGTLTQPVAAAPEGTWSTLSRTLTVPAGVAEVRVVLLGGAFGVTRFDNVGLWG